MAHNEAVDVVLVGAGIMSATTAVLLKELRPAIKLEVVELMDSGAAEFQPTEQRRYRPRGSV